MTKSIYMSEDLGRHRSGYGITTRDLERDQGWDVPRVDYDEDQTTSRRTRRRQP